MGWGDDDGNSRTNIHDILSRLVPPSRPVELSFSVVSRQYFLRPNLPRKRPLEESKPGNSYELHEFRTQSDAFNYIDSLAKESTPLSPILKVFSRELSEKGKRTFIVAILDPPNHMNSFWNYFNREPLGSRHYYEIIRENTPCRLYLDLEYPRIRVDSSGMVEPINSDLNPNSMTAYFLYRLSMQLKLDSGIVFKPEDTIILESSSPKKFSRHVVVSLPGSHLFRSNIHVGILVSRTVNAMRDELLDYYLRKSEVFDSLSNDERNTRYLELSLIRSLWPSSSKSRVCNDFPPLETLQHLGENGISSDFCKDIDVPSILSLYPSFNNECFIDRNVYTKNRAMRFYLSSKYGKGRELLLSEFCRAKALLNPPKTLRTGNNEKSFNHSLDSNLLKSDTSCKLVHSVYSDPRNPLPAPNSELGHWMSIFGLSDPLHKFAMVQSSDEVINSETTPGVHETSVKGDCHVASEGPEKSKSVSSFSQTVNIDEFRNLAGDMNWEMGVWLSSLITATDPLPEELLSMQTLSHSENSHICSIYDNIKGFPLIVAYPSQMAAGYSRSSSSIPHIGSVSDISSMSLPVVPKISKHVASTLPSVYEPILDFILGLQHRIAGYAGSTSNRIWLQSWIGKEWPPQEDILVESSSASMNSSSNEKHQEIRQKYPHAWLSFVIGGSRYCEAIGREHKSNNVRWNVDFARGYATQSCFDADCRVVVRGTYDLPIS